MAQTDLGIANLAFLDMGQPALVTGAEESKAGRLYRATFEPTVLEILRAHPWRCAQREAILTVDALVDTPFDFDYACTLPNDFVKVVKVNDHIIKFKVIGQHLCVDDNAPRLTYIARVPTGEFDPLLVSVIAARLSWRWCIHMTDSATQAKSLQETFQKIFADAKFSDALDGAPEDPPMGTWAEARLSEA